MASAATVTVVIATRDRVAELRRTLAVLTALPEGPAVIVVDNGSRDGTARAVRGEFPGVTLIRNRRNRKAAARNQGVRRAATPYVAFSDDDSWWDPGALARACDLLALDLAAAGWAAVYAQEVVARHFPSARRNPGRRRAAQLRNRVLVAWLRRPPLAAFARTAELARTVPRDRASAAAFAAAAGGLPWVLRERRPVPRRVEQMIRALDAPRRASAARRYVG